MQKTIPRKSHDGSRADLIESMEHVEGKVYQITSETLPYLYRREGVKGHIYRPAFIDVTIDIKTYKNVLTFLVVDKEKGVAPPQHYAAGILRGAKGFVMIATILHSTHDAKKAEITWIPTLEHMLEDALLMIGLYVWNDEALCKMKELYFLNQQKNHIQLYDDIAPKRLEEMRAHCRDI